MALFVKQSDEEREIEMVYTTGLNKSRVFIGLGNPGKNYNDTRHNIGFKALDVFAEKIEASNWVHKKDLKSEIASTTVGGTKVILVKPQTFMNNSGEALAAVLGFYNLTASECVVVHDEIDLELGKIQVKIGGGNAGHNGLKSIAQHVEGDIARLRIGIGPKTPEQIELSDFVLQKFSKPEAEKLPAILLEVSAMLGEATASDLYPDTRTVF